MALLRAPPMNADAMVGEAVIASSCRRPDQGDVVSFSTEQGTRCKRYCACSAGDTVRVFDGVEPRGPGGGADGADRRATSGLAAAGGRAAHQAGGLPRPVAARQIRDRAAEADRDRRRGDRAADDRRGRWCARRPTSVARCAGGRSCAKRPSNAGAGVVPACSRGAPAVCAGASSAHASGRRHALIVAYEGETRSAVAVRGGARSVPARHRLAVRGPRRRLLARRSRLCARRGRAPGHPRPAHFAQPRRPRRCWPRWCCTSWGSIVRSTMTTDPECIFCKIVGGQIPADIVLRTTR